MVQTGEFMCLGIPGRIISLDENIQKLATVDVGGVRRQINISCIVDENHSPQSCIGEWVLVHVGFAMSRINAEEAAMTLKLLEEMGEVQAEIAAMRASGRA
jgi:hydrogenase expression/formation protein HypC